jgi:hypothetical protein
VGTASDSAVRAYQQALCQRGSPKQARGAARGRTAAGCIVWSRTVAQAGVEPEPRVEVRLGGFSRAPKPLVSPTRPGTRSGFRTRSASRTSCPPSSTRDTAGIANTWRLSPGGNKAGLSGIRRCISGRRGLRERPDGRPHQGGYTGFSFDITEAVHSGDNLLAVRVNNLWNPELAPRAGEHVFSGGIYRNVRLVITEPLHVTWYGTFVTTPKVSAESGAVNVKTEIRNDTAKRRHARWNRTSWTTMVRLWRPSRPRNPSPPGASVTFDQNTPDRQPVPASGLRSHPNLYSVVTKVFDGKALVDTYRTTFGFRWFKWTADQGFFLNGEHLYFKG